MGTLEQRLQVLERQFDRTRRFNRVLIFAIVAVVCIAGAQRTKPTESQHNTPKSAQPADGSLPDRQVPPGGDRLRTVEADQFVLLDRLGRSRAKMVVTDQGPALTMFDENGRKRLELSHTTDSSGLRLLDSNEAPVASLQVPKDVARAQLEITSPQGTSSTTATGFSVQDSAEKGRLLLALINGNSPVFGISHSDQSGPHSVEITCRSLQMHDDGGHRLFSVTATKNGTTHLSLHHPDHERSLQISAGPDDVDGPRMDFFAPAKQGTGGLLPVLQLGVQQDRQPYIRIVDGDGATLFTAPSE